MIFFVNIGPKLANEINAPNAKHYTYYLKRTILSKFQFELIDETETNKLIQSLKAKDSAGHDGITTKILKVIGPILSKSLTLIINQSLITGVFPDNLKVAKVVPLYKKDDHC